MTAPHASCSVFLIKKIIVGGVKVDNIVTVGGQINASINFAMQQNYVPVIRSLVVNNNSEEALENIGLKITFEPEFAIYISYRLYTRKKFCRDIPREDIYQHRFSFLSYRKNGGQYHH